MKQFLKYFALTLAIIVTSCTSTVRYVTEPVHEKSEKKPDVGVEAGDTGKEIISEKRAYQTGIASYYADKFHGRKTSSGETYDKNEFTAAHRELPFGTKVKVTNLANDLSVIVRINDRGPQSTKRLIDLSRAAAEEIDMIRAGVIEVSIEVIE